MNYGYIALHRKILENPILNRSRIYSNFEAWIWLLLKANHKDNKFMLGSDLVKVKRGQIITSQKKLCRQFRWGNSKLRNFLKVLQKDEMILLNTNTQSTQITICNYETYQENQTANKLQTNLKQTTNKLQTDTNNNDKNDKNEKNDNNKRVTTKDIENIINNEKWLDLYGHRMLQEFIDYWIERNGKKAKHQMQKTFEIGLRLKSWSKKDYNGAWLRHKEERIQKEQDEYYKRNSEQVSEEESLRQKEEMNKLKNRIFKRI